MKICRQPVNPQALEFVCSYDASTTSLDGHDPSYDTHWVIEMPSKDNPNKREEYITVRTLGSSRDESISGRATIVWAVIKVEDMRTKEPPHKVRYIC